MWRRHRHLPNGHATTIGGQGSHQWYCSVYLLPKTVFYETKKTTRGVGKYVAGTVDATQNAGKRVDNATKYGAS